MGLLLSNPSLTNVNVKSYRRMRIQNETDWRVLVEAGRNGRFGSGILVVEPSASGRQPNVTGPVLDWTFPIISVEHPDVSMNPVHGSQLSAEQVAQIVLDSMQLHADDRLGTFSMEPAAIKPEREFVFDGCVAYRVNFHIVGRSAQTPRVAAISVSVDGNPLVNGSFAAGTVTLSCGTPGASIWYTVDGTFPTTDVGGNAGSELYEAPFSVAAGQVLRAVAYADGYNNSSARYALAT